MLLRLAKALSMLYDGGMSMTKAQAIQLIGPTMAEAATAVGVTRQAIKLWPDPLPARIEDRVLAVQARRHLPARLIGGAETKLRRPPVRKQRPVEPQASES